MPTGVSITWVGVRGRLHHECADEIRSQDIALATLKLNLSWLDSVCNVCSVDERKDVMGLADAHAIGLCAQLAG